MRVPSDFKKGVVFIGRKRDGKLKFSGTGFFVARRSAKTSQIFVYLVTAKHVAVELTDGFFIRVNQKNGKSLLLEGTKDFKWTFNPNEVDSSDVAVFQMFLQQGMEELDIKSLSTGLLLTDEMIQVHGIGDGDDVAIIGLFAYHYGNKKNLPIVRTGNIAMMPDEPIETDKFGNMDAYLIEGRSIGGLSGSPVYVIKSTGQGQWSVWLLGLIHGHWDLKPDRVIDSAKSEKDAKLGVNVGIAIVVPARKILETLEHPSLVSDREKQEKDWIAKNTPPVGEQK